MSDKKHYRLLKQLSLFLYYIALFHEFHLALFYLSNDTLGSKTNKRIGSYHLTELIEYRYKMADGGVWPQKILIIGYRICDDVKVNDMSFPLVP